MNLNTYLQEIESEVVESRKSKTSKVEKKLYNIVLKNIENKKPNTIKALQKAINHKHSSYLHQIVKKSERLTKVKVKGLAIVIPKEETE